MDEQILYSLAESLQSVPSSFRCSDGPRVCLRGRLPVGACALQAPDPWGLSSLSATIFVFSGPRGRHLHTSVWVPGRVTIQHCSPRTKVFPEMGTWELPVLGQLFSLCRCARCCWRVVASEPYKRACVRAHTHGHICSGTQSVNQGESCSCPCCAHISSAGLRVPLGLPVP